MLACIMHSELSVICHNIMFEECGGLMSLADQLDIQYCLYVTLMVGNCDEIVMDEKFDG